jgi:hypothetical protein
MLLVRKSEGKRPLGSPRCRWVDNIKIDLGEIGWVVLTELVRLGIGASGGSCKWGNGFLGSMEWRF